MERYFYLRFPFRLVGYYLDILISIRLTLHLIWTIRNVVFTKRLEPISQSSLSSRIWKFECVFSNEIFAKGCVTDLIIKCLSIHSTKNRLTTINKFLLIRNFLRQKPKRKSGRVINFDDACSRSIKRFCLWMAKAHELVWSYIMWRRPKWKPFLLVDLPSNRPQNQKTNISSLILVSQ